MYTKRGKEKRTSIVFAGWFIYNSAVFKTPQVKHPDAAILTTTDKHVHAVGAKSDVVDFLVVGNELGLCRQRGNVPDGACRVDARGDDQAGRYRIPVKRGQGGSMIGGLAVGEEGQWSQFRHGHLTLPASDGVCRGRNWVLGRQGPQPKVVSAGCEQVGGLLLRRRGFP